MWLYVFQISNHLWPGWSTYMHAYSWILWEKKPMNEWINTETEKRWVEKKCSPFTCTNWILSDVVKAIECCTEVSQDNCSTVFYKWCRKMCHVFSSLFICHHFGTGWSLHRMMHQKWTTFFLMIFGNIFAWGSFVPCYEHFFSINFSAWQTWIE